MNFSILTLLITPFVGGISAYFGRKVSGFFGNALGMGFSVLGFAEVLSYYNVRVDYLKYASIFGYNLTLRINSLSWFFLIITSGIFVLVFAYSNVSEEGKFDSDFLFFELLLLEGAVFGILLAGDLFTFLIFFELIAVITYFLASKSTSFSKNASMELVYMNSVSSSFVFLAIIMLTSIYGSFDFVVVQQSIASQSSTIAAFVFSLLFIALLIRASLIPFHRWAVNTYVEITNSLSSILFSVSSIVSIYALILFVYLIFGSALTNRTFPFPLNGRLTFHIISWMSGLTILFGTFISVLKKEPKKPLAYLTVTQAAYILLAFSTGTPNGIAAGLLQLFNTSIFMTLLFLSTNKASRLTECISEKAMLTSEVDISFLGTLFAVIALVGLPPTGGFVSKWMIYKELIQSGHYFLLVIAIFGSIGSFLYCCRLIRAFVTKFLHAEHEEMKRMPLKLALPIVVLMTSNLFFGVFPGILLKPISLIQQFLGLEPIAFTLTGFPAGNLLYFPGNLNIISASFLVVLLVFLFALPKMKGTFLRSTHLAPKTFVERINRFFELKSRLDVFYRSLKNFIAKKIYARLLNLTEFIGDSLNRIYASDSKTALYYMFIFIAIAIFAVLLKGFMQ